MHKRTALRWSSIHPEIVPKQRLACLSEPTIRVQILEDLVHLGNKLHGQRRYQEMKQTVDLNFAISVFAQKKAISDDDVLALSKPLFAVDEFMSTADRATNPQVRFLDGILVSAYSICGKIEYDRENYTTSLGHFSKLTTTLSLWDGPETRLALLYSGLTLLKLGDTNSGLDHLCRYFKAEFPTQKSQTLLFNPRFPTPVDLELQIDYCLTTLGHLPPKNGIQLGWIAISTAEKFKLSLNNNDAFWETMVNMHRSTQNNSGLIKLLDRRPQTIQLSIEKGIIATKFLGSSHINYRIDGIIATHPISHDESTWIRKNMRLFYQRCRTLIYTPNHHLHHLAVAKYGLWFGLSHRSGELGNPAYLLSCGDVMTPNDELGTTLCIPFGTTTTICPCCKKDRSFKILKADHIETINNRIMTLWNDGNRDSEFLRLAFLSTDPYPYLQTDPDYFLFKTLVKLVTDISSTSEFDSTPWVKFQPLNLLRTSLIDRFNEIKFDFGDTNTALKNLDPSETAFLRSEHCG